MHLFITGFIIIPINSVQKMKLLKEILKIIDTYTENYELNSAYYYTIIDLINERLKNEKYAKRRVLVKYMLDEEQVVFQIKDEGSGFNVEDIPDPTDPENILKSHGRGIMMSRLYFDEFEYNDKGNQLTMVKNRIKE